MQHSPTGAFISAHHDNAAYADAGLSQGSWQAAGTKHRQHHGDRCVLISDLIGRNIMWSRTIDLAALGGINAVMTIQIVAN
jgi:hypothetical protein